MPKKMKRIITYHNMFNESDGLMAYLLKDVELQLLPLVHIKRIGFQSIKFVKITINNT